MKQRGGWRSEGVVKLTLRRRAGARLQSKYLSFVAPVSRVRMCCLWARQGVGHGEEAHKETRLKTGQIPRETALCSYG